MNLSYPDYTAAKNWFSVPRIAGIYKRNLPSFYSSLPLQSPTGCDEGPWKDITVCRTI
jgi:hypothetical protein